MSTEEILSLIISIAPAVTAVLTALLTFVKIMSAFKSETKTQTTEVKELRNDVKRQNAIINNVVQANRELLAQLNALNEKLGESYVEKQIDEEN